MRFSIITPSFRNSDWLRLCIASVADQRGVEIEHIVCRTPVPTMVRRTGCQMIRGWKAIVESDKRHV